MYGKDELAKRHNMIPKSKEGGQSHRRFGDTQAFYHTELHHGIVDFLALVFKVGWGIR